LFHEWQTVPPYLEIVDRLAGCGDHHHSLLSHPHRELINDGLKRNNLQIANTKIPYRIKTAMETSVADPDP
jgi:hypothetical protein